MALDYRYTCPDIDRSIAAFKSDIESHLSYMLDDCCPMLEGKQKENFIKYYAEQIYNDFEANFEDVRKTNEDMRKQADYQIEKLESEIDDLKSEIKELESQLDAVS